MIVQNVNILEQRLLALSEASATVMTELRRAREAHEVLTRLGSGFTQQQQDAIIAALSVSAVTAAYNDAVAAYQADEALTE